jgi:ribosomal protein S18 acetylase RimI-like enzyme
MEPLRSQHDLGAKSAYEISCISNRVRRAADVELILEPFAEADRPGVTLLMADLPMLYPGGGEWLQRRLTDVVEKRANCTLAFWSRSIAGITIETPKGTKRTKLSTIFVNPIFRKRGVGSRLLRNCLESWRLSDVDEAIVTVRLHNLVTIAPLLMRNKFEPIAIEQNRYGDGNDETVFRWLPHEGVCSSSSMPPTPDAIRALVTSTKLDVTSNRLSANPTFVCPV